MVFCNSKYVNRKDKGDCSHNPYFNRWFSAIRISSARRTATNSHNPYFNRWFSAMTLYHSCKIITDCHNPYFNRWFSAIRDTVRYGTPYRKVTILILIDGFLQF